MARVDSFRMRAGQIFCACDIDGLPLDLDSIPKDASVLRMALAFGASVLAQVLTLSVLPVASASFAPFSGSLPWPYMALLLGASLAGFPASLLLDRLGRQSAFALGASLGLAGGILSAFAFIERLFPAFIIGLLWLGMAQGFGLFYRHAGAIAGRAGGLVFGAGALGALIGPFVIEIFSSNIGPSAAASLLVASGLAHLITLGLAIGLPGRQIEITLASHDVKRPPGSVLILATIIAALAWFGMNGVMARAPLTMAGCGLTFSMSAIAMAAHLSAMYWPGFTIGHFVSRFGTLPTSLVGLALLSGGGLSLLTQSTVIGFTIGMAIAGYGWGMATIGSTAAIHRAGHPSAFSLAMHDVILFLGALTGAALFGQF